MFNKIKSLPKFPPLLAPLKKVPIKCKGFGEYMNPPWYSKKLQAKKISAIANKLLLMGFAGGTICAGSAVLIPTVSSAVILQLALISTGGFFGGGILKLVSRIQSLKIKSTSFGATNNINKKIYKPPTALGTVSKCDIIPCENSKESFEWKKELIRSAEHNIVLSGNYCGGTSFDEVLDLIEEQFKKKPDLKVAIISSDQFINSQNQSKINALSKIYPDRFQLVESPLIWHRDPGLKKTTNHSKILCIDYGKYFLLGGSGLEDKYAYAEGLGDRESKKPASSGWIDMLLPRGFRDQDFVFKSLSNNGSGRRIYIETLKLMLRWEALNNKKVDPSKKQVVDSLIKEEMDPKIENSSTVDKRKVTTKIAKFENNKDKVQQGSTKIYCTGPEHTKSPFEAEIVERINKAKDSITIDHLYFHPSGKVMQALIDAGNRGVKIKIVTNSFEGNKISPTAHAAFGHRNHYNYQYLASRIDPKYRSNLEVYAFIVRKTTLHKKVIVIDDYVIAGSSNLGYKSLVTMSDHEMNFVTKNAKLADKVREIINQDSQTDPKEIQTDKSTKKITIARRIKDPAKPISWKTLFLAGLQRAKAPLIG